MLDRLTYFASPESPAVSCSAACHKNSRFNQGSSMCYSINSQQLWPICIEGVINLLPEKPVMSHLSVPQIDPGPKCFSARKDTVDKDVVA